MKLVAKIVSALALAVGSEAFDDGSPSLLQLRTVHEASPNKHIMAFNSSHSQSGHAFGCTGRETAPQVISCGLWGDVHQHLTFQGGGAPNSNGIGWFWLAKSRDGEFGAQAFYRQHGGGWTTMSHFAFKFGDQTVFLDRVIQNENSDGRSQSWLWKYYWNGQERTYDETPLEVGSVYWVNRAAGDLANTGAAGGHFGDLLNRAAIRNSCFEYLTENIAIWVSYQTWQGNDMGPYGGGGIFEIEGAADYLDPAFGQCANNQQRVAPNEMLVTIAQNDKVCNDNQLDSHQCEDPDPPPAQPTVQELCGCQQGQTCDRFEHAQELCAGQQDHSQDIYDDCLYDVCASFNADAEQLAAGGAALEAAMANPRPTCLIKPQSEGFPCRPCNICSAATPVDLSNIVQNNLGGAGPDSGAQEIRYKNAINLDGRLVDVVLTAVTAYQTPRPDRNGNNGRGFGKFTIRTGTSSDLKFEFQDATTFEAVAMPDIALTFYDLDEAIEFRDENQLQQETITACAAEEVYVTEDTELVAESHGLCRSFTSSVIGTGADNPRSPDTLTKTQAARTVTYEFHTRAHIFWTATVTGNQLNPRPVLFSFVPQVACGASDSETQCRSYSSVHGGHCAGGWLGGNSNQADEAACSAHCRTVADCRYFAFCRGPEGCDGATNCAVYNEAAGCPDDNNWGGYEAYINDGPIGGA